MENVSLSRCDSEERLESKALAVRQVGHVSLFIFLATDSALTLYRNQHEKNVMMSTCGQKEKTEDKPRPDIAIPFILLDLRAPYST